MLGNKGDQFPRVASAPAPQVDIDALLGGLHGEFQADMRAMSAAGAARVEEKAVEVAASVDARVENDGRPRRRPIDDYTQIKREAVEQWFDTTDRRSQLERMRICLFDLGRICGDISNLRGWRSLTAAVESLPEHELIDKVSWSRKLDWLDTQFAALENPDKSTDLETPEKLKELHLQLHDLLVASQKTLSELRKGPEVASDAPRGRGERETIDERNFSEKLTEATSLLDEWSELRLQLPTEKERKEFDAAVREKSGETRLPGLNSHKAQLAYLTRKAGGEGVADDVGAVKHYDLGVWLQKYRRFVQVAREVANEFREKSQSDRRTRKGGSERAPEDLGTKEGQIRSLEQRLERWSRLVREFEIMGQANRLAEVMATFLVAKKIPKWDWREQHEAVKRELGDIRSGESKRKEEKQAAFIESNIAWYDQCIQAVEPVLRSLKGDKVSQQDPNSAPAPGSVPPAQPATSSTFATPPARSTETFPSGVPAPAQEASDPKVEREQKQRERTAQRLEELQSIVEEFRTLYNEFHTTYDIHKKQGTKKQSLRDPKTGRVELPPLDEDEGVVTNQRELLKQGIHDIYADFLLAATSEKLREKAEGKGVEGRRQFEVYKNHLMNLYNRLWAQTEAIRESGRGTGTRDDRSDQDLNERRGQGARATEAKPAQPTTSPEALEQQKEVLAELEKQRDRWRARIEALSNQKEFDTLTSEAGKNGSWTTVPGFVVGNALVQLLRERSITDPAVVQAIKDQAFVLQRELNPLYLAKRDEFYPARASDAKASKQEAPQSSVNSEVWTTNKLLDQVADGSAIMLTSPDRKNREVYRRSGESFFSPAEKGQSPVAVPIDVILTKLNDPKKPWSFVGRQLINVTKSEKEIYQGESVMRLPRSGEVVFYSRAVNKNDKEYKEGEDQEFEMSVRFDGPNTYSARDGRNGTHSLGTLNQKDIEEVLTKEGWKVVGSITEASKQETLQPPVETWETLPGEEREKRIQLVTDTMIDWLAGMKIALGAKKLPPKERLKVVQTLYTPMIEEAMQKIIKVSIDTATRARILKILQSLPESVG